MVRLDAAQAVVFQSTLPTRGSDADAIVPCAAVPSFNPRSPRGGATCKTARAIWRNAASFNPRSPRGGATNSVRIAAARYKGFNPRSPRGGATQGETGTPMSTYVSIHAPHEGERLFRPRQRENHACFNPRSPRGGATWDDVKQMREQGRFQSTLPTRGSDDSAGAEL